VIFAYVTGWRVPSEVLTREWHHVDFERKLILLELGETNNGKPRIFPLTPELLELLREQRAKTDSHQRESKGNLPLGISP